MLGLVIAALDWNVHAAAEAYVDDIGWTCHCGWYCHGPDCGMGDGGGA